MTGLRVLVTGARGFIGAATVRHLEGAGFAVRAGMRAPIAGDAAVLCDLDRPETLSAALAGIDCVVHTAYGDVERMGQQCEALLDAMRGAGVPALVHLSSIAVYGALEGEVDETVPLPPPIDAYAAAKIDCEAKVVAFTAKGGSAIVLRPGIVYGRGSHYWIDKLCERIRLGAWGTYGPAGEGIAALIHVDDLAAMIGEAVSMLTKGSAPLSGPLAAFNAVGPETPGWNAYFTALAAAIGASPLPTIDSATLGRRQKMGLAAKLWRKAGLPGGAAAALVPQPAEMALFSRKARYAMGAAATRLSFRPTIGLAEGLRRSL